MSWKMMLGVHMLRHSLSHANYRLMMVMADHAHDDGRGSRAAVDTMAAEGEMSDRTVQRGLQELERMGLITETQAATPRAPSIWRLNLKVEIASRVTVERGDIPTRLVAPEVTPCPSGVTPCPNRGDTTPPEPVIEPKKEPKEVLPTVATRARETETGNPIAISQPSPQALVLAAWDEVAVANKLPRVATLTTPRRQHLDARVREHGLPAVLDAIAQVGRSDFCCGRGNAREGWRADFDFVLQPKSFSRLIEGSYANRVNGGAYRNGAIGELAARAEQAGSTVDALYRREMDELNAHAQGKNLDGTPYLPPPDDIEGRAESGSAGLLDHDAVIKPPFRVPLESRADHEPDEGCATAAPAPRTDRVAPIRHSRRGDGPRPIGALFGGL